MTTSALFQSNHAWPPIFWISNFAWISLEVWILARDRKGAPGAQPDRGSLPIIGLLVVAGVTGAFLASHLGVGRIAAPAAPLFYGAIALIWLGIAFRTWAVLTLGRFFRTAVAIEDDHQLVTAGPYRLMRNPAYTGALTTAIGVGAAMGSWISVLSSAGALTVGYIWRIHVEEEALSKRFGAAFDAYKRGRWALVPFIW